jgi:hypothetical protein
MASDTEISGVDVLRNAIQKRLRRGHPQPEIAIRVRGMARKAMDHGRDFYQFGWCSRDSSDEPLTRVAPAARRAVLFDAATAGVRRVLPLELGGDQSRVLIAMAIETGRGVGLFVYLVRDRPLARRECQRDGNHSGQRNDNFSP